MWDSSKSRLDEISADADILRGNLRMLGPCALSNRILARQDEACGETDEPRVVKAKNGKPSMTVGGISVHSLYDPEKEGREWVREALSGGDLPKEGVLVLGLGMGYHVAALLSATSVPVFVFEPDIRRIRLSFSFISWDQEERWRGRIHFLSETGEIARLDRQIRLLVHAPSERSQKRAFSDAKKLFRSIQEDMISSLRILVVPPVTGGSYPVAVGAAHGLKAAGHRVSFFDASPFEGALLAIGQTTSLDLHKRQLQGIFSGFMDEMVMARVLAVKPDLVVALAQAPMSPALLSRLRDMGYPVAYWFVEDFRLTTYWERVAPLVHDFAVIQKEPFLSLLARSGVRGTYLPAAADPSVFAPRELSPEDRKLYGAPVGFMGAGYHNRQRFLPHLADLGLKVFGTEWNLSDALAAAMPLPNRRMTPDECARIFCATTVNVNLHSSVYHNGVNPDGDFVNPRTFEIASCGGYQVVDRRSLMEELFQTEGPDAELCFFDSETSCRREIRRATGDPEGRRAMADRARKRVLACHTYQVRMEEWVSGMLERGLRPASPALTGRWPVEGLLKSAGEDRGLSDFLKRFRPMGSVGLDDLVGQTLPGKDEISPEEATFLLMKEFSGGP